MTANVPDDGTTWARVERLDAAWAVAAVLTHAEVALVLEAMLPGGQVGAARVRWPDGHRSVLTWLPGQRLADLRTRQLATVEALRQAGYPCPAVELVVELDRAVVLVQELLPGAPLEHLTDGVLDQAMDLNDRQSRALADRPEVPLVRLYLRTDGPGFCLHEPLRRHSRRSARLEAWVLAVADEVPADVLVGVDAVHTDFQPANLLVVGDQLTGVIDWDGAGRGDRRFDLVTLRFSLLPVRTDAAAVSRLDEVLDAMPPDVLRPAWAHMSLRMTDWAIRHFRPADVDAWLDVAEERVS